MKTAPLLVFSLAFVLSTMMNSACASDFGPTDHLGFCVDDSDVCRSALAQLTREWPKALKGDYQSQRNVAFCLQDSCGGAILKNSVLSCAWRMVILASGSGKIISTDISNYKNVCERILSTLEFATAQAQAGVLFVEIFHRPMPPGPWTP